MTRTMHDSFVKEWMEGILTDFGEVEIEKQIAGEVRKIDLYFCPNPSSLKDLKTFGLLGRMLSKPMLMEAFRNAAIEWDIRNSREKVFQFEGELAREAQRKVQPFHKSDRPFMWVLTPTFSKTLQQESGGQEKRAWGKGIYFLANMDRTAIVVIHQLPRTIDTLFLRLLGRGKVQAEAIDELRALPLDHPYRGTTLHHISRLQINLKLRQNKTKEIREIIMNLAPAYDAWLEEVESKAIAKGKIEGKTEGKTEEQVTIARRMLSKNLPLTDISDFTGLSIEFLQTLQNESSN
jgi:hypothetical protein